MGIASDPSDVAARSARNLKDVLRFLNMSSLLENFESKELSLIELSSLDHGDLEDLGVLDVQKRELFVRLCSSYHSFGNHSNRRIYESCDKHLTRARTQVRAAKKIEQRILMERSKTIGEICDVLRLVTSDPKRPVGDLLACETVNDLKEHFGEVKFKGNEEAFLRLASSLREKETAASVRRLGDDDDDGDDDDTDGLEEKI